MKVFTVVGARPQFIKAATVSREIALSVDIDECIVHTGQHYDQRMSDAFFQELSIPAPKHFLEVGSGAHGLQTGRMLIKIEEALIEECPDVVLVYGDTNSTIAGALAAAKMHIPVIHVEAGLRSFNRKMPEEINRVTTDHLSSLLLCPTQEAVNNLTSEGITQNTHCVGDVMYDGAMFYSKLSSDVATIEQEFDVEAGGYALFTCHRPENTDNPERFSQIQQSLLELSQLQPVVFPVHPRVKGLMSKIIESSSPGLRAIPPASYLEMLELIRNASVIVTDSGGLQKEAFFFGVPCVTMRDETEWNETVDCGANMLAGASKEAILEAFETQAKLRGTLPDAAPFYGDGLASKDIVRLINEFFHSSMEKELCVSG